MRRAVWTVVFAGVFLLLLSTLVVTPEAAEPPDAPPIPTDLQFAPAALPPVQAAQEGLQRRADAGMAPPAVCALCARSLPRLALCDANGRVVTAARYEKCVYQLFRAEVAGG